MYQTATGTSQNLSIFYRFASNEPASYTHSTLTSGRWVMSMAGFSGVNSTPLDVAVPAAVAGTTALTFPAITPVTAGAWTLAIGHVQGATGAVFVFSAGNNDALVVTNAPNTAAINPSHAVARRAWTSGAFTPTMTYTGTSTRTLGSTGALRPSTGAAPAVRYRTIGKRR